MVTFLIVIAALLGSAIYMLYSDPSFASALGVTPPGAENIDAIVPVIAFFVGIALVILLVRKIMTSELAVPFVMIVFVLLVIGGATYLYEPTTIDPIQPVGGNPALDSQYADINRENTTTNLISEVSFTLRVFMLLVSIVVGAGIALFSHWRANASK